VYFSRLLQGLLPVDRLFVHHIQILFNFNFPRKYLAKLCEKTLAKEAIDFITVYIKWHSLDLMYWHQASQNLQKFPASCAKISGHVDPQIPSKEKQA
jgi:hypothetical protein